MSAGCNPALPLTQSGKIDRRKLPDPAEMSGESSAYVPPRNEMEAELVRIWQDLLGRKQVGIHDNFFEIGGNSIKIIRLAKAASRALGREVSVALLFQYANIQELVDYLTQDSVAVEEEVFDKDELLADLDKFNFDSDDFN
jgi:acyl carrier protein